MAFPGREYRSLEDPDVRLSAHTDPREILDSLSLLPSWTPSLQEDLESLRSGRKLIPLENKSAGTFTERFLSGIAGLRETVGGQAMACFVLYNGKDKFQVKEVNGFPNHRVASV
jgi:hypothetical protein